MGQKAQKGNIDGSGMPVEPEIEPARACEVPTPLPLTQPPAHLGYTSTGS